MVGMKTFISIGSVSSAVPRSKVLKIILTPNSKKVSLIVGHWQFAIHLPSVRFHVCFHVTLDDLCCKQTPKVRTSVLCHILCLCELQLAISSSH